MNSTKITKEQIEASGKMRAEQGALHALKPIVSSLIDSVRGDHEMVITVEIVEKSGKKVVEKGKSDEKTNKGKPPKQSSKPTNVGIHVPDEGKAGDGVEGVEGNGDTSGATTPDQELDPLSGKA